LITFASATPCLAASSEASDPSTASRMFLNIACEQIIGAVPHRSLILVNADGLSRLAQIRPRASPQHPQPTARCMCWARPGNPSRRLIDGRYVASASSLSGAIRASGNCQRSTVSSETASSLCWGPVKLSQGISTHRKGQARHSAAVSLHAPGPAA